MATEAGVEDEHPQILQETLQQILWTATKGNMKCCVICLGDAVEQCEARPCRHNDFDYLCLITWLETRPTCPLCKSDVSEVRYDLDEDSKFGKIYKVPNLVNGDREEENQRSAISFSGRQNSNYANHEIQPRLYDDEAIRRRRLIYRNQLYSLYVGSNSKQPPGLRHRELSPQLFATSPELVSRASTWLRRELRVFRFLYAEGTDDSRQGHGPIRRCGPCKAEYLLEYIIAILKSIDMQGSAVQAEEMIQEFLGRNNTRLFLHELRAWLRSPCTSLSEWDRVVQYRDEAIMR